MFLAKRLIFPWNARTSASTCSSREPLRATRAGAWALCAMTGSIRAKSIAFALMLPVMAQSAHAPARVARRGSLEEQVDAEVRAFHGKINLFAKNIGSGRSFGYGPDARVRTASTIKLPLLAAAFQAVAEGKASWDDRVTLSEEDKAGGAGI